MFVKGQLFTRSGGIVDCSSPASVATDLDSQDCRLLIKSLGGFLIRYTDGFHSDNLPGEWYSVVCRHFVSMDKLPQSKRYKINRSLKHFDVRRLTAQELTGGLSSVYTGL